MGLTNLWVTQIFRKKSYFKVPMPGSSLRFFDLSCPFLLLRHQRMDALIGDEVTQECVFEEKKWFAYAVGMPIPFTFNLRG